jgi:hypothetical protein
MRTRQFNWTSEGGLSWNGERGFNPAFVLFFGSREALQDEAAYHSLHTAFPDSHLIGCSTGGQFDRDSITDDRVLAIAVGFNEARAALASAHVASPLQSYACGAEISRALARPDLRAILVISDGLAVNGSELVAGLASQVGPDVTIGGGLAGDGASFETTLVVADGPPVSGCVAALGLYGESLDIRTGSAGGWDAFGPRRRITRAERNVLYELDGRSALELYERYLGPEEAQALPGSGLLFPLRIDDPANPGNDVVRTILAIDRDTGSMTFAGDMPEGWTAQLMRGSFDRLMDGAADAARQATAVPDENAGLTLLVSCIGRRLLMGQRAIDEIEAAAEEISRHHALIGFYSYGEISPHSKSGFCQLHNQTMTVMSVMEHGQRG